LVGSFSERWTRLTNINSAACLVWRVTSLNFRCKSILKNINLHPVQLIYKNLTLQDFIKWTNCNGECIAGNVQMVLRRVKGDGANSEKVRWAGAWYREDSASQYFIVDCFIHKIYLSVFVYNTTCSDCSIFLSHILRVTFNK
jgi:hypothetical protein